VAKHEYTVQVLVGIHVVAESPEAAALAAVEDICKTLENAEVDTYSRPWVTSLAFCDPAVWDRTAIPGYLVFKNKEIIEEGAL
jgi:hypothetical protein